MKKKIVNLKTNKALLSVSTAFLVISSVVPTSGNAAQVNEFSISSDKQYVTGGETFNVDIDFFPDAAGASGFTFELHYDRTKLEPVDGDNCGVNSDNGFYVLTTDRAEMGTIRVVGAYLSGDNVTDNCKVASVGFNVLDGAAGELDYWIDMETLVCYDGNDYVNTDYSVADRTAPYKINVLESEEKNNEHTNKEQVTAVTEPVVPETVIEAEPEVKTDTAESEPDDNNTQTLPEPERIPETETKEPVVIKFDLPEEDNTEYLPSQAPSEVKAAETSVSSEPLYEYTESPENEPADAVQYGFNISDYITDYSDMYDIHVKLASTGYVNGCIGMMDNSGSWISQQFETFSGEDEWVFTGLQPDTCWDQVFVQVYYIEPGAELDINSVTFTSQNNYTSFAADQPIEETNENCERSKDTVEELGYTPTVAAETDDSSKAEDEVPSAESSVSEVSESDSSSQAEQTSSESISDNSESKAETSDSSAAEEKHDAPEQQADNSAAETKTTGSEKKTDDSKAAEVENKVAEQAKAADSNTAAKPSTANPNTGSRSKGFGFLNVLKGLCLLEMFYTLFAFCYNKRKNSNDSEE